MLVASCGRQLPSSSPEDRDKARTGLRYHDKSVYDLIKNLVRFLSPRVSRPGRSPCRVAKDTSPPEASIPSSSSTGGSELLVIQTGIWTFSRLYAVLVHEFIINRLRHVPFRVLRFASLSTLLRPFFLPLISLRRHNTKHNGAFITRSAQIHCYQ